MKCRHQQIDRFAFDGTWRCRDCRQAFEPSAGFTGILRTLYILAVAATIIALISLVV